MALDNETYDLIDEYLQSAIEVMKEMYKEYGEEILTSEDFDEYFDEFRDRTYELTETIPDEMLEGFKDFYLEKLNEKFDGEVTAIAVANKNDNGELEYHLRILDTLVILHNRGKRIEYWGFETPYHIKCFINEIVMK